VTIRLKLILTSLTLSFLFAAPLAHALFHSKTKAAEKAGAILFRDKGCAHCHGVGGVGGKKAPALTNLRKDKKWTPARITKQILSGGQKMPAFADSVTDAEAADLVAYLRARHKPIPPPPAPAQ
jgi:mono/diheme cytochrome c family protein